MNENSEIEITAAEAVLVNWGRMTPTLIGRDARVVDLLLAEGPRTQAELVEQISGTSTWTWRRLSTGVHKDEVRGQALIEKVKVGKTTTWQATEWMRVAAGLQALRVG